jgi:hypothetical protein
MGLLLLAAAVVVAAGGCNWFGGNRQGTDGGAPPPAPAGRSMIPDVPIPDRFVFVSRKSNDQTAEGVRVVVHQYRSQIGSMKLEEIASFYRDAMPAQGWQFVEESFSYGTQRLMFKKGNENCFISIWKDWYKKVMIQIYPEGGEPPMPPGGVT